MLLQRQLEADDCWRTCIAVMVSKHACFVPHFYKEANNNSSEATAFARSWLKGWGFRLVQIAMPGALTFTEVLTHVTDNVAGDCPFILSGQSTRGINHSVICSEGKVLLDPFTGKPNKSPFIAPCYSNDHDELFWVVEFVVKR